MPSINFMLWNSAFISLITHLIGPAVSIQHRWLLPPSWWFFFSSGSQDFTLTYLLPHFFLSHLFWIFFIPVCKIERPHTFNPLLYYKYKSNCMVWCFRIMLLERNLESPLDCKEITPVNPKGNQSWIFIGRTEAEAPAVWPSDAKNRLIGKDPDAGEAWGQEKNGVTEDEMDMSIQWTWVEQTQWDSEGQGRLVCCSSWGCKEST